MSYYFSFFRIFRFEHTKLTQFFTGYNIVDTSLLASVNYNQNFNSVAELQYQNLHVNNNFKLLTFASYFALMPLVLGLNFFMLYCISSSSNFISSYFNEKIAQKYFFSGPMVLICLFMFPIGVSILLEFRFFTTQNELQWYSFAVCSAVCLILVLFFISMWVVILSHYKHKQHPLVVKRYDFIFQSLKHQISPTFLVNACIPLMTTKRAASMIMVTVLCRYTLGPLIILAFLQIIVRSHFSLT